MVAVLLLGLGFAGNAAPYESSTAGLARRGPAGSARAAIERAEAHLAAGDAAAARTTTEALLRDLRARAGDPDEWLDAESVESLALAAIAVRNRAVRAEAGLGDAGEREAFLAAIADEAVYSDWRWDVPASVTLAQAILESSWGRSAPGHNLFGIKGEGPAGATRSRVVEYVRGRRTTRLASFRAYHSPGQSVRDHGRLLGEARYYTRARAVAEDRVAFAQALVGVYASDPRYATKLAGVIEARGLGAYDWSGGAPWAPVATAVASR